MITKTENARAERTIHRSYARDVERPLAALRDFQAETLCHIEHGAQTYPLFLVRSTAAGTTRPTIFISGGVHGDEPAGVYAAIDFLEDIAPRYRREFNFTVLPCANPSGFELNTLRSISGANLNRLFGTDSSEPEIRAIEEWLTDESHRFLVTFDLHETVPEYEGEGFTPQDNPRACYLYETARNGETRIGKQLIDALPQSVEVCRWPKVYLDVNSEGVISYPEACGNPVYAQETTFEAYLMRHNTNHAFTTETPTGWPLEKRIQIQLCWLETALELLKGKE
jgi:hypothetical protein